MVLPYGVRNRMNRLPVGSTAQGLPRLGVNKLRGVQFFA